MATALEVARHLRGTKLNIFDHEQLTITDDATGDVLVNLVARLDGVHLIYCRHDLSDDEAISMAILALLRENESLLIHSME